MIGRFRKVFGIRSTGTALACLLGLSVSLACCILVFVFTRSELAVNRSFSKADTIYRLDSECREPTMGLPVTTLAAAGPTIVQEFPEAVNQVRIYLMTNTARVDDESFRTEVMMADTTLFRMFDLPFRHGNRETALDRPRSVVVSREFAAKAFGSSGRDILGETVAIETWNSGWQDYTVTGILDDVPINSVTEFSAGEPQDLIIPPTPYGDCFQEGGTGMVAV